MASPPLIASWDIIFKHCLIQTGRTWSAMERKVKPTHDQKYEIKEKW